MWKLVCSACLISAGVYAQPADSLAKKDYRPTGLRVGTDLIQLGKTVASQPLQGWEVNADLDFYRYYLTVDVGQWQRDITTVDGFYSNNGGYLRVGVDVNFLLKDPDRNMFFIGFRYGRAQFNERISFSVADSVFGDYTDVREHNGVRGGWGELTTGLRVRIWKGWWMGYTARFKFAPGVRGTDDEWQAFDIPGYGPLEQRTYWGFNYQVFWKIPFRKPGS